MTRQAEAERIYKVYKERYSSDRQKYSLFCPGEHYMEVSFEKNLISALKEVGITSLADKLILEIGCGNGLRLRNLQRLGAIPSKEYGIELLDFHVEDARLLSSNCHIEEGDASALPYPDNYFDVVLQRTVFTSIRDRKLQKSVAAEMIRVAKPSGIIIWYDFIYNNPANSEVQAVSKRDVKSLFEKCEINGRRITLAPPISRHLAKYSWFLCEALEAIRILNTHYLALVKKMPQPE